MTRSRILRQKCTFSDAEVYIDVYEGDDNFVTSGATLLSDLKLQETYRAIASVATGRILSLFEIHTIRIISLRRDNSMIHTARS